MTTRQAPIRAAVYCRISKDRTGQRAGVERQQADCHAKAEQLGWPVIRVYIDNDISAYSGKLRPDYQALCDDIKNGVVNAVIAWHPDRLHRSPTELEDYIRLCGELVQNTTVTAGFWDLSTPSGRMNARNMGNYARYESEHKSERVKAAMATDARNGKHHGGIRCFGYAPDGMTVWEDEAVEIRRIADAITKGVSLRSLARELNQRGIPTTTAPRPAPAVNRPGKHTWTQAKLRGVMLSPRLAGHRTHHGEVVGKGQWPAILDEATYEAMRSILTDPKRRTAGPRMGRTPTALGTGLYRCMCGAVMRKAKTNAGLPVYRCAQAGNGGKHASRRADMLDRYVADALIERLSQPGYVQAMADQVVPVPGSEALIAEREANRIAQDELAKAMESGTLTAALAIQLARQAAALAERCDEISHLLAQSGQRSPVADLIGVTDIVAAWEAMSLPVQRAILAAALDVTVHRGRRGPYFDTESVVLTFTKHGQSRCG